MLLDVNIEVHLGQVVALVGPSSAGCPEKTILIDLIPRFYDLTRGGVYFDGVNCKEYTIASLCRFIRIVPQNTVLFRSTLRDNIGLSLLLLQSSYLLLRAHNHLFETIPRRVLRSPREEDRASC